MFAAEFGELFIRHRLRGENSGRYASSTRNAIGRF